MQERLPIPIEAMTAAFEYAPLSGQLWRTTKRGKKLRVGSIVDGRVRVCFNYQLYHAHRIIWAIVKQEQPPEIIDHIDGDATNNRIENLREATHAQNLWNTAAYNGINSGHKGVQWHVRCKKWHARTTVAGKTVYFGLHEKLEDAVAAYEAGVRKLRGEFHRS